MIRLVLFVLALTLTVSASAALPGLVAEGDEAPQAAAAETAIAQAQQDDEDPRIARRIEGIFAELPGFETVGVEVSEGVVRLTGSLPEAEAIARAEGIAARVSGVVTVENAITRDLSVGQNLSIFSQIAEIVDGAYAALPLFGLAALVALVIGALGYAIAGAGSVWDRIAPNAFLAELIRSAIRFLFVIFGLVIALDMLGAGALLGAVLGGAGVLGIALGFAMRDMIENYVASLMLSLRQPFRPKDHVLIDSYEGRVIRLTSRATILMTLEGNHLRIPNSQVFKAVILNYSTNPQRRFDFELGIDSDDDPRPAMKCGIGALQALPFLLGEPEPKAHIRLVGDSNITLQFFGWIDQREADWLKSRSLAIAAVKDALEAAGFQLPEPIYRLRFDGRTDPLPIGRSGTNAPSAKLRKPAPEAAHDVAPEREIAEMIENERGPKTGRRDDLLDPDRPIE
ncbi:mechanosensitive ion channel domain-containing protein [Porphyrobacter sp. AAP60]|uniref:mechanosensitive ion channel domain-containing protein n=1 Tax=Porphyrobacter sp. AAP60 TaxID=1523423 RepID=UPI0006B937C2|nr:mechanosensitive ion channel domain-containing protein [Porphyrobacter sp. AAP60]KPF63041.1 MscS mechanosensitive ion channel [Porphyrobacter sp. AAP60]